jgi:hypothetical protein
MPTMRKMDNIAVVRYKRHESRSSICSRRDWHWANMLRFAHKNHQPRAPPTSRPAKKPRSAKAATAPPIEKPRAPVPVPATGTQLQGHHLSDYDAVRQTTKRIIEKVHGNVDMSHVTRSPSELAQLSSTEGMRHVTALLSQHPHDTLTQGAEERAIVRERVTILPRKWEQEFMREAHGQERRCVNWMRGCCFASKLEANGLVDPNFALVEFYDPQTYEALRHRNFQWPAGPPNQCILCLHEEQNIRFVRNRAYHRSLESMTECSSIGNVVDQPGEYRLQDTNVNSPNRNEGLVVPLAVFRPKNFSVHMIDGIRHLKLNLPTPTVLPNFYSASFDSALC